MFVACSRLCLSLRLGHGVIIPAQKAPFYFNLVWCDLVCLFSYGGFIVYACWLNCSFVLLSGLVSASALASVSSCQLHSGMFVSVSLCQLHFGMFGCECL